MRAIINDIQDENGLVMAVYLHDDMSEYSNQEAAAHLQDEHHLDGFKGNYWSGTHPAFNPDHGVPFTAVIDLITGEVLATDPIPEILTPEEVMEAVEEANSD